VRRFISFGLALVCVLLVAVTPARSSTNGPAVVTVAAHSCSSSYVHAALAGEHKCLRSGQFCAKRHERVYRRLGFTCKPGSDGRLRLHRR
jgi:hypothetical protein